MLVIDQFEVLFTLADAPSRVAFDTQLSQALSDPLVPLYLVSTIRSDFIDQLPSLGGLSQLLNSHCRRYLVLAITPDGLRQSIEGPARRAGLDVAQVSTAMLREALGEPSALPLVEHALTQLWQQRQGSSLSGEMFERSGGLAGMLSRSADSLLNSIAAEWPAQGRSGALELLLALTRINTADRLRHTRQRLPRAEAVDIAGQGNAPRGEQVLQRLSGIGGLGGQRSTALGHVRLVTTGSEGGVAFVELIHETLVRAELFAQRAQDAVAAATAPSLPVRWLVVGAEPVTSIDLTAAAAVKCAAWRPAPPQVQPKRRM